jgi:hypothetical protein
MSKADTYDSADNYFAILPQWVLFANISPQAIRLYAVLRTYADNKTNTSYPSRASLANDMKVASTRTVDAAIKELVEIGALKVQNRASVNGNQTSNLYTLISTPPSKVGAQNIARGGVVNCEGGSEELRTNYNHLTITTELDDPKGSTVQELVKLYFDLLPKDVIKPTGRMIAGQIQQALKTVTPAHLAKLVEMVATEGMPVTPNTLMVADRSTKEMKVKVIPTPTPATFVSADYANLDAVPMPENLKEELRKKLHR